MPLGFDHVLSSRSNRPNWIFRVASKVDSAQQKVVIFGDFELDLIVGRCAMDRPGSHGNRLAGCFASASDANFDIVLHIPPFQILEPHVRPKKRIGALNARHPTSSLALG
jgi:hypothetical protein